MISGGCSYATQLANSSFKRFAFISDPILTTDATKTSGISNSVASACLLYNKGSYATNSPNITHPTLNIDTIRLYIIAETRKIAGVERPLPY